jgi:hypothetical protein
MAGSAEALVGTARATRTATHFNTMVLGIVFAIAGLHHGFFEALQGNVPTGGWGIASIGEAQRAWEGGSDAAVTLIPNFLATGIAAMAVSVRDGVGVCDAHGPAASLVAAGAAAADPGGAGGRMAMGAGRLRPALPGRAGDLGVRPARHE